jgi:xanthine/uracil permease
LIQWLTGGLMRRIRVLFPPEVCGVVVMMLGVSLLPGALRRAVGIVPGGPVGAIQLDAIWISLFTLAAMVAVSIWLRGGARFFAMLLGCAAGLLATLASRGLSDVALAVGRAEWLAMPELAWPGLSLDAALIPVVLLLAVVSAIDGMGVLIGTDRLDDAQWFRPNLPQLAAGIRAVGTTNVASALLGGTFTGLSGSNLGLAFATGVTSRVVGLCVGVALMAACFLPKLTALVLALPEPVLGGILLYASAYFLVSGADLALSRMLSQRRMLVIGLALAAGIATQAAPEVVRGVDGLAGQIVRSPLALAALVAVALNALFRIGIATSARIEWTVDRAGRARLREALSDLGEQWGLHRETVRQADDALTEAMDLLASRHDPAVPLVVDVRSDEMHLYLRLEHAGAPVQFPERAPTHDEFLDDPDGTARMSAWILRHQARRVSSAPLESPRAVLTLVLEN